MARADSRITLAYLRRCPDSARSKGWAGKLVHIETEHGIWRNDAAGYTHRGAADAWILPLEEALLQVAHLGPEKRAALILATPPGHPREGGDPGQQVRVWRCFHCGDEFTEEHSARLHFGATEDATAACQIKGSEGGLVEALRRAERDAAEAWHMIHSETTDFAKAYHAQAARHQEQLRAVEQIGYDRGIADAKAHPETLGLVAAALPTRTPPAPVGTNEAQP